MPLEVFCSWKFALNAKPLSSCAGASCTVMRALPFEDKPMNDVRIERSA